MTAYVQSDNDTLREFNLEPERVEAVQWNGDNIDEIKAALPEVNARFGETTGRLIVSTDSSGECWIHRGDYVCRSGAYRYPMFQAHFEQMYRLAAVPSSASVAPLTEEDR